MVDQNQQLNVYLVLYGPEDKLQPLKIGCHENLAALWSEWRVSKSDKPKSFTLKDGPGNNGKVVHVLDPKLIHGVADVNFSQDIIDRTGEILSYDAHVRTKLMNQKSALVTT